MHGTVVERYPHYILKKTASQAFSNLQIIIHEVKWVMISKGKVTTIHFVIHHPKFENVIEIFSSGSGKYEVIFY